MSSWAPGMHRRGPHAQTQQGVSHPLVHEWKARLLRLDIEPSSRRRTTHWESRPPQASIPTREGTWREPGRSPDRNHLGGEDVREPNDTAANKVGPSPRNRRAAIDTPIRVKTRCTTSPSCCAGSIRGWLYPPHAVAPPRWLTHRRGHCGHHFMRSQSRPPSSPRPCPSATKTGGVDGRPPCSPGCPH